MLTIVSCTVEDSDVDTPTHRLIRCEYVPKGIPEEIVLSNGEKIYMDIDSTYFLGDIIFNKEQVEKMTKPITRSAVVKSRIRYWPNKTIPYKINNGFSTSEIAMIHSALQSISSHTGIQFTETGNTPAKHIEFVQTYDSFSSPLGMQNNGNYIQIGTDQIHKGIILHEIMHTLGYFHEHQRSDRDSYVNIYFDNIIDDAKYGFKKYTVNGYEGYDIGNFDYESVLLYHSEQFCIYIPNKTIKKIDGTSIYEHRWGLSDGDIEGLKFVYGPEALHLNREVIYESYYDDNEYAQYSNTVDFRDSNGNSIVLDHPRLVVVNFGEYVYDRSVGRYTNNDWDEYYIAPAGSSTLPLNVTEHTHEEEGYGIIRTHYDSYYSVYSY